MTAEELFNEFREKYPCGEFSAFTMAIFVTAVVIPRERQKAYELGFNRELVKPSDAGWPRNA